MAFLEKNGVVKSVYVKWSGNGCHVHVNEKALSEELTKRISPLDAAYAMVEYTNAKLQNTFYRIVEGEKAVKLKIENKMDPQRVFSCPLTLHRELAKVCVCIDPDSLDSFTPDWTRIEDYRHLGVESI